MSAQPIQPLFEPNGYDFSDRIRHTREMDFQQLASLPSAELAQHVLAWRWAAEGRKQTAWWAQDRREKAETKLIVEASKNQRRIHQVLDVASHAQQERGEAMERAALLEATQASVKAVLHRWEAGLAAAEWGLRYEKQKAEEAGYSGMELSLAVQKQRYLSEFVGQLREALGGP